MLKKCLDDLANESYPQHKSVQISCACCVVVVKEANIETLKGCKTFDQQQREKMENGLKAIWYDSKHSADLGAATALVNAYDVTLRTTNTWISGWMTNAPSALQEDLSLPQVLCYYDP